MSVGLFINTLKSWFWGMAGTFTPAGVGGVPSPSQFYNNDNLVKIESSPTQLFYALWYIGAPTATCYWYGYQIEINLADLKGRFAKGSRDRITSYMLIKNFLNSLEAVQVNAGITEQMMASVSTINIGAIEDGANGSYDTTTGKLSIAPPVMESEHFNKYKGYELFHDLLREVVLAHELKHATDVASGITNIQILEKNAYEYGMQYFVDGYLLLTNDYDREMTYRLFVAEQVACLVNAGVIAEVVWPYEFW